MLNRYFGILFLVVTIACFTSCKKEEDNTEPVITDFTDVRDGMVYKTVKIGDQIWMAENLKYLPDVFPRQIVSETEPLYYVYDFDGTSVEEAKQSDLYFIYGALYNWEAAQLASPAGWHLPSEDEWTILINHLGGINLAHGSLKEQGTAHWRSPNSDATNESGFNGRPGGSVLLGGFYYGIGNYGNWWEGTESENGAVYHRTLGYDYNSVARGSMGKKEAYSIRCIKD